MGILKLAAGVAVGYVLGSRAGREKYESIAASARKAAGHPRVVEAQEKAKALIGTGTDKVNAKLHATAESARPTPDPAPPVKSTPTPASSVKPAPTPAPSSKPTPTPRPEVTEPLTPVTTPRPPL
ncbi:hypothetical protein [Actinoplanes sp. G11-F43]|uniref:hypothetical protein n=1 Tax=Actinoplanes sp. G11-F43 TaxID=3424130 RepID=UPI003D33081A